MDEQHDAKSIKSHVTVVSNAKDTDDVTDVKKFLGVKNDITDELEEHRYGWYSFRPQALQRFFNTGLWFLFLISSVNMLAGAITNGMLKVSITSLERRFKLTSADSGIIISMYDVAGCVSILPISHLGGIGHKPRWIGYGLMIQSLGVFLFSMPHFLSPEYTYSVNEKDDIDFDMCTNYSKQAGLDLRCTSNESTMTEDFEFKYMFMCAQFLSGLGATPLSVFAITYMDENVDPKIYPFYIGIYFLSTLLGPAIGFTAGSYALTKFVETSISPQNIDLNSRYWVGRWWIGFIVSSFILFSLAVPICAFPDKLPHRIAREWNKPRSSQLFHMASSSSLRGTTKSTKNLSKSVHSIAEKSRDLVVMAKKNLRRVITNPSFMLLSLAAALLSCIVTGFLSFGPKYIESSFGKSPSEAAKLFGFVCVPAATLGLLSGALIMSVRRTSPRSVLKICFVISFLTMLNHGAFLWKCDNTQFAGYSAPYPNQEKYTGSAVDQCHSQCHCTELIYDPVCANNITYFSPCHAGCSKKVVNDTDELGLNTEYYNCSCILESYNGTKQFLFGKALKGKCDEGKDCVYESFIYFSIFFMIAGMFFCVIPGIDLSLGCFPLKLKSLALGVQWMVIRLVGTIPGPVIFGWLFDTNCLVQARSCGSDTLTCVTYDNKTLANSLFVFPLLFKVLSVLSFLMAAVIYKDVSYEKGKAVHVVHSQAFLEEFGDRSDLESANKTQNQEIRQKTSTLNRQTSNQLLT